MKLKIFLKPTKEKIKKLFIFLGAIFIYSVLAFTRTIIIARIYPPEGHLVFYESYGWIFTIMHFMFLYLLICLISSEKKIKFKKWISPNKIKVAGLTFYIFTRKISSLVFFTLTETISKDKEKFLEFIGGSGYIWMVMLQLLVYIIIAYITICILTSKKK